MTVKNTLTQAGFAALCAISLSTVVSGAAMAGSVTYPGELVGVAWAPLPEGVYAVNTSSLRERPRVSATSPASMSTSRSSPGRRLGPSLAAALKLMSRVRSSAFMAGTWRPPRWRSYTNDFYNPFVAVGEFWDLGHGFYVANFVGTYLPIDNALGQNYWTPNDRFAFGYTADGWDLTSHTTFGFRTNDITTNFGGATLIAGTHGHDYINEDLTATKKLGKWEVGPVAFGSWDIGGSNIPGGNAENRVSSRSVASSATTSVASMVRST